MLRKTYYSFKGYIPRRTQISLRGIYARLKRRACTAVWPIDRSVTTKPASWRGWPHGKQFAFILTHDVEDDRGQRRCLHLANLEKRLGFRSSFNFVPERYPVLPEIRASLVSNGFEVGVHGLLHDGKLYNSWSTFQYRARKINRYLYDWHSVGFRSPAMHHNLEWLHNLDILYDSSTFDTDPFEPQSDPMKTIFPFMVSNGHGRSYVELPYTLPQDFTLFILLQERTTDIWKAKLEWIAAHGGMALLNTHPDYMHPEGHPPQDEHYPLELYESFLQYTQRTYRDTYWHVLPRDVALHCIHQHRFKRERRESGSEGHAQ